MKFKIFVARCIGKMIGTEFQQKKTDETSHAATYSKS